MAQLNKKKIGLIIVGIVIAIGVVSYVLLHNKSTETSDATHIRTSAFSVTVPEGTQNESDGDNVYFTIPTSYGELRGSVVKSSLDVTQGQQSGDITTSTITVDGVQATRKDVDYSSVVKGTSTKQLIRYDVSIDKINKPSASTYTTFEVQAFATRDLTASEIANVKQQAQQLLDNLVIK